MVYHEVCTEDYCESNTFLKSSGTDEQKRHTRQFKTDKRPQQRNVQRLPKLYIVDDAGIGGRKKRLPGGGALRKCPVDIFSERARWRVGKRLRVSHKEKSAEVIVVRANEVRIDTAQVSQTTKD